MNAAWVAIALGAWSLSSDAKSDEIERAKPHFLEACTKHCEAKHAMQAVSAEMIRAQCEDTCRGEWARPIVRTAAELKKHDHQRVRLEGTISDRSPVDLVLKDGHHVTLDVDPDLSFNPRPEQRLLVAGMVVKGTLTQVSAVAPISP